MSYISKRSNEIKIAIFYLQILYSTSKTIIFAKLQLTNLSLQNLII